MLTAQELTRMREVVNQSLPDICTIQSKATVSDGQGGQTESYSDTATNVPCRVKAGLAKELLAQYAIQGQQSYTVTLPYNQAISQTDRIVWNGRMLEVSGIGGIGSWQVQTLAYCVLIS